MVWMLIALCGIGAMTGFLAGLLGGVSAEFAGLCSG